MATIHNITPQEAQKMLEGGQAVLIDVRERFEHLTGAIAQAKLIPLSEVAMNKCMLPEHKGKKLILHCRSGKRSLLAAEKLQAEGLSEDAYNMAGGFLAWQQAGLPVEIKRMPLEQQTQLTIGVVGGIFVLLSLTVHPYFALLPLFMFGGLTFAGATGWCGLTKVLAFMPWNR